ncbi:M48 family metallopeptidase [Phyllobacterium sp. TAF24]|uniref:M48 family metallopeptidase n=1 Tax=Phyllobacterium sp. TAF24 TaxID=3233068 RepID=UPI003F9DA8F1
MDFKIAKFRHPKEKLYGTIMLAAGLMIWIVLLLAIAISVLKGSILTIVPMLAVGLLIWFASFVVRSLIRAHMLGHYVLVSPNQFPQLHRMIEVSAQAVGLKEAPETFIYNSHGVMNAFAVRLVGRKRYIWLTSALIDADNGDQIRFVVGHELGHHVAGHLNDFSSFLRYPAYLVPFLGQAYSRARELTCDRVGHYLARDVDAARTALQMLACGSAKLNKVMNPQAFQDQEAMVPSFWGFILHIFSYYPRLTKRVQEVANWGALKNAG